MGVGKGKGNVGVGGGGSGVVESLVVLFLRRARLRFGSRCEEEEEDME